jgi:hypothetical protein
MLWVYPTPPGLPSKFVVGSASLKERLRVREGEKEQQQQQQQAIIAAMASQTRIWCPAVVFFI